MADTPARLYGGREATTTTRLRSSEVEHRLWSVVDEKGRPGVIRVPHDLQGDLAATTPLRDVVDLHRIDDWHFVLRLIKAVQVAGVAIILEDDAEATAVGNRLNHGRLPDTDLLLDVHAVQNRPRVLKPLRGCGVRLSRGCRSLHEAEQVSGGVALEAAPDLGVGLLVGATAAEVVRCWF